MNLPGKTPGIEPRSDGPEVDTLATRPTRQFPGRDFSGVESYQ